MLIIVALALAEGPASNPRPPPVLALAALESRSGSTVTGTVAFKQDGPMVHVTIDLAAATPGDHAVHIHEKGDCSAPDAASAGSHFNPKKMDHGDVATAHHHPGDFGNVTVAADGKGHKEFDTDSFTLMGGELNVTGLAIIVHEKPDDFGQPTGNAGGRQACGVIK